MGQLYDPKNIIFREGTTRKDYEENYHRLHMLYEALDILKKMRPDAWTEQNELEKSFRFAKWDYEHACKALFGRAKREAKARAALEKAQQEYEEALGRLKNIESNIKDCETAIDILTKKMQDHGYERTGPLYAKLMHHCFAEMRANTLEEALKICKPVVDAAIEKEKNAQKDANYNRMKKTYQDLILLQTASDREIALHKAQVEAEEARIKAETAAAKAHNAAVMNDYLWHAMAGDISDMESYALMKVGELEI